MKVWISNNWHIIALSVGIFLFLLWVVFSYLSTIEEDEVKKLLESQLSSYNEQLNKIPELKNTIDISEKQRLIKQRLILEFDQQLKWQWQWEKLNRRYSDFVSFFLWIVDIFILGLTLLVSNIKEQVEGSDKRQLARKLAYLLLFFAFINIGAPSIAEKLEFQDRQEAHDRIAREITIIRMALETDLITPAEAWKKYEETFGLSLREYVRRMKY